MYQFTSPPKQNYLLFLNEMGIIFFTACTNLNIASIIPSDPSSPCDFFFNGKSFMIFKILGLLFSPHQCLSQDSVYVYIKLFWSESFMFKVFLLIFCLNDLYIDGRMLSESHTVICFQAFP